MDDFYFGSGSQRRKLSSEGKIRKIYTGIYTSINTSKELEKIMKLQWPLIVANAFKNSVISYRSAIEFTPSPLGYIYLISKQAKVVEIGGIKFKLIRGTPESISNRNAVMGAPTASMERAFLDSLIRPKIIVNDDRYIPIGELEDRLENILTQSGEEALNYFRETSKRVSLELNMPGPYKKLDTIIGALLGSKDTRMHGIQSIHRAKGLPVDNKKVELFLLLGNHLETIHYSNNIDPNLDNSEYFENKAFFESYFSNYIEGTDFLIEEAEQIIFDKKAIKNRVNDSHDISGTFEIVSNKSYMSSSPNSFSSFIDSLRHINKTVIPTRLDKFPGEFKTKENRAGNTIFVHPDYIEGTLKQAFKISRTISNPVARGIFLNFVVSEVHPFSDGNGRTCRIVLNRELLSEGLYSIIIPTVYREDYLLTLRTLSRKSRPDPVVRMFLRALKFSRLDFSNYQLIKNEITERNWFLEPDEGKIIE
ncbi:MAG: Fic family protein [Spirochaetaceae bacterium]|nr:Fic family protein [Spirochaetaceae bacterium]